MFNPDLIIITETWLCKDDVLILPVTNKNFNVLGCDRLTHGGGGVVICVKDNIPYYLVSTFCANDGSLECISLEIYPNSSLCIRFILLYNAPRCSLDTINSLTGYLAHTIPSNHNAKYVILKDFNLPSLVDRIDLANTPIHYDNVTQTFADFCNQFGLQ
jgi:hypothetical protein